MSPQTQKALLLESKCGQFVVGERKVDKPGPGELLIKVHSVGLNPADWKLQKYGIFIQEYPSVLGADMAGEVEEIGEGVTGFQKGDKVFSQSTDFEAKWGGFQHYAIVLAPFVAKIPEGFSYDEVASIPLALATAYGGLYHPSPYGLSITPPIYPDGFNKYSGEPFVVIGGSSAVGQMAIQLARISGFSPIITTASLHNAEDIKALGATHVFDRKLSNDDLALQIQAIIGDKPLRYAFESIGSPETLQTGLHILAAGGALQSVTPPFATQNAPYNKKVTAYGAFLTLNYNRELYGPLFPDLVTEWVASGKIKSNRVEVLPDGLEGIKEGLKRLEADTVSRVKLIAHPQETQ